MYILVTYDVSTITPEGQKRLRHVAKACLDYGQRVQNSVFECKVDPAQFTVLKNRLLKTIDYETDSIRIYHLGTRWHHKIEHYGTKEGYDVEGDLIL